MNELPVKKYLNQMPKLLALLLSFCLAPLFGQQYPKGAILDPVKYQQADAKPALLSRSYTNLPRSASLRKYSPVPENQGEYGTCVGWATAFAARTISESQALNRTNRDQILSNVFSPAFVYKSISNDPTGQSGSSISNALDYMKNAGVVKRLPIEKTMRFENIALSMYSAARRFPISGYVRLFSNPRGEPGTISERVPPVKLSLAQGKPVIIGMNTPGSFHRAKDVWRPVESPNKVHGGHAMCVVGYNDDRYGGAFEVQNSWGTMWGNGGYAWITYSDFAAFVSQAYEVIENLAVYKDATRYAASIQIEVDGNKGGMPVALDRQGFYRTRESHPSGTEFRFLMTNRHPAYVYAFAADSNTSGTVRIFPLSGSSPVLDYTNSAVAWPGEYDWIRLDQVAGTDYLVVLFSKGALDINAIERQFAGERGGFSERVARAVGANFIPYNQVDYDSNAMKFSAVSTNPRAVFGLLLAIGHR